MKDKKDAPEIVVHRPTGPRLTFADPVSKGELVGYRAGKVTQRALGSVRNAVASCKEVILRPKLKHLAFHSALVLAFFLIGFDPVSSGIKLTTALISSIGFHPLPFHRDANGWSVIDPVATTSGSCGSASPTSNGTCIWYVSNAGTDDNTNCIGYAPPVTSTPATTCATPAYALTKIRSGKPDWVLLKRGDTFANTTRNLVQITVGATAQKPFLLSAYPQEPSSYDDRPIIDLNGCTNCTFIQQQAGTFQGAITSLKIINSSWDPNSANYWNSAHSASFLVVLGEQNFLLVEDCEFDNVGGMQLQATTVSHNLFVRRNVFYNPAYTSIGLINSEIFSDLTIEENLFYKGYTTRTAGASAVTISAASPAVVTYASDSTVAPENGGIPPLGYSGAPPLVWFSGSVPTGLTAATNTCLAANQCYYLCNISGATANLSANSNCSSLINTSGSACNSGCFSHWVDTSANIYSHNIYLGVGWDQSVGSLSTRGGMVFQNNITAYASATGSQARPGGRYWNNLYLKNPIQITGIAWPSNIGYNVMLQTIDMQTGEKINRHYGQGMEISNYTCGPPAQGLCTAAMVANPPNAGSAGSRIHHNILAASEASSDNGTGIRLNAAGFYNVGIGANILATTGITVDHNIICDWPAGNTSNVPYKNNGTGNTIDNTNLPDPTTSNSDATCASLGINAPLTVGNYYDTIGGGGSSTTDNFLDAAKTKWTKISWDARFLAENVNAYIRPSYGMSNP